MTLRSCLGGGIGSSPINLRQHQHRESSRLLRLLLLLLRPLVQGSGVCMPGVREEKEAIRWVTLRNMTCKSRQVPVALTAMLMAVNMAAVVVEKVA